MAFIFVSEIAGERLSGISRVYSTAICPADGKTRVFVCRGEVSTPSATNRMVTSLRGDQKGQAE